MQTMIKSVVAALLLGMSAHAVADTSTSSLLSGYFDDHLMIAADQESGTLSGYYNDGKCRLFFQGPLQVVELYQRKDFGEAYTPSTTRVGGGKEFTTEIYSRARGGFQEQVESAGEECRWIVHQT
jgi:hypothetical protein